MIFAETFNGWNGRPISLGECGMSFTLTSAIVYDMFVPDKEFTYKYAPPISNGWVLFLIVAELLVAFVIGVSCIVLNLNLMKKVNADDDVQTFMRLTQYQSVECSGVEGEDSGYGSATVGLLTNGKIFPVEDKSSSEANSDED